MLVGVPEDQFLRSIQLDSFSCGSHSVFMVLRFFGITLRHGRVKTLLGTNPETGTAIEPMVRLLRRRGLRVGYKPNLSWRELLNALRRGGVVLVALDGDHFAVVHAADHRRVFVADPSLLRCPSRSQVRHRFLSRWTRWGLIVSRTGGRNG
jgi:predicted double-glycine peptidase